MPESAYHRLTGDEKDAVRWAASPMMRGFDPYEVLRTNLDLYGVDAARQPYVARVMHRWQGYCRTVRWLCRERAEANALWSEFV